ncbi:unnamed protein product, partial [Urochloa humidicola]
LARASASISIWATPTQPRGLPSTNEGKDCGSYGGEGARSGGVGDLSEQRWTGHCGCGCNGSGGDGSPQLLPIHSVLVHTAYPLTVSL